MLDGKFSGLVPIEKKRLIAKTYRAQLRGKKNDVVMETKITIKPDEVTSLRFPKRE
jgi:hypothetical protein